MQSSCGPAPAPPATAPRPPPAARRPASRKTRKKPTLYPSRAFTLAPLLLPAGIVSTLQTTRARAHTHKHTLCHTHTHTNTYTKSLEHEAKNNIVLIYNRHEHKCIELLFSDVTLHVTRYTPLRDYLWVRCYKIIIIVITHSIRVVPFIMYKKCNLNITLISVIVR